MTGVLHRQEAIDSAQDQSAMGRAWDDTHEFSHHWWGFRFPSAVLTVAFAGLAASLPPDADSAERVALGIAGAVGGSLILAFASLAYFVGAAPYRQRNELRDRNNRTADSQQKGAQSRQICEDWCKKVEKLLDSQAALKPRSGSGGGGLADILINLGKPKSPEDVMRERECEQIDRETVRIYIERHREEGTELFDILISAGKIVPTNRPKVHKPSSVFEINSAIDSMRTAAERI